MTTSNIVIVGASLAGAKAAETLREQGYDGRVTLLGDEPYRPYERPPLSKSYLQGTAARDAVFVHTAPWYAEHDVDLRLGTRATAVDATTHEVLLADGERIGYDALLLATGSAPRRLDVPGADLAGVHYLRRLDDADALRAAFARAGRVAVIGARVDRSRGRRRGPGGGSSGHDPRTGAPAAVAGPGAGGGPGVRRPSSRPRRGPAV